MKSIFYSLVFLFFFSCLSFTVTAQSRASITISNEDNKTTMLSVDDIKALPHTTLQIKAHDEKMHDYQGVDMNLLLRKAGVTLGDSAKKTVGKYVLITASDHYSVVYALAEMDSVLSHKKIILADEVDGKALPSNATPFQIIATEEKIHARMIRQVVSISVRKAL